MGKFYAGLARELTLYARHLAWLHATPKPPEGSKRAARATYKPVTRLATMTGRKITPAMPPNRMPHIITRWIEIGMTAGGGMAPAALSWLEINEWQKATCVTLSPWEARTIHALSVAYIAEGRRAEEETCPPPWRAPVSAQERASEESALLALVRRD